MRSNDVTFRRGVVEGAKGIGCCVFLKIGMAEQRSWGHDWRCRLSAHQVLRTINAQPVAYPPPGLPPGRALVCTQVGHTVWCLHPWHFLSLCVVVQIITSLACLCGRSDGRRRAPCFAFRELWTNCVSGINYWFAVELAVWDHSWVSVCVSDCLFFVFCGSKSVECCSGWFSNYDTWCVRSPYLFNNSQES